MVVRLSTELEINAKPEDVRAAFPDFPSWPQWHTSFISSVILVDGSKSPMALEKGDKLVCASAALGNMTFEAIVDVNTPEKFMWTGSLLAGFFAGRHTWQFAPSEESPGKTRLIQYEDYTAISRHLFKPGWPLHNTALAGMNDLNADLKRRVEDNEMAGT